MIDIPKEGLDQGSCVRRIFILRWHRDLLDARVGSLPSMFSALTFEQFSQIHVVCGNLVM